MGFEKQEEKYVFGSISLFFWIWSLSAISFLDLVPLSE
jgi:hypothetical protein